ncbi:hypothetical protein K443DRAFT_672868 [Laccaria amethystina LaAM-08-1]|uniref:Sas10 C-terminal domain-containing protein n=1 Tax=Laccaria amethystina LaAM-08-1 TaxID=1095629 RepID=A0A0C9YCF1_9AGAR|nr:hypothetical protein K443DRAFT_672868 [Laccaria amethystina LaAM-08-1]
MPRRRPSKTNGGNKRPRSVKRSEGKINKWNTIDDIPLDEEDQFHASRDKILLDGGDTAGYDDGDDDEVFALKGMPNDSDEDEDEFGLQEEDEDMVEDSAVPLKKEKKKDIKKKKGKAAIVSSSSEEERESDEEETWGRGKAAYYSSNADQLESDDEEGNELEEQEAKRLQAKMREGMGDADFGLNDAVEMEGKPDFDDFVEAPPIVISALPTDKKLLLRHLEKTSPEALALARDWDETAQLVSPTREKLQQVELKDPDALHLGMLHLHYQALLSYATTLAFYLHLRSSDKYVQRPTLLQSHPVLQRLLTLKQSLITLEDLDFAASDDEDSEVSNEEDIEMKWDSILQDAEQVWELDRAPGLEPDELEELLKDAEVPMEITTARKRQAAPPKKKRKVSKEEFEPITHVFDLVEPDFAPSKKISSRSQGHTDDSYGDADTLQHADAADKTARRKTLRFHTSKIESASARRQGARNQAVGGDDDLPYRERKKEKEARLAKEAKNKVQHQGGADLDDEEPQSHEKRRREEDDEGDAVDSPDEYYELVKNNSKEKKEQKKAEYKALQAAAKPDLSTEDVSGPRSLTRAIMANKGLTPHRPKSVRNPRVKKRQKFEKAKRKISSQKAVYSSGISDSGRYDGEKTGISKVVKSIRLG